MMLVVDLKHAVISIPQDLKMKERVESF